jgi:hypothetical protein
MKIMRKVRALASLMIVLLAGNLSAADRQRMRAFNVGLHPVFMLASAALQRKLHNHNDVIRCLTEGAAAGYVFFESKVITSQGHVRTGFAMANVASSVTRNVIAGRHPFARLGLTIGPSRTEVSTPFEKDASARFHVQFSLSDVGAMVWMKQKNGHLAIRSGRIGFRADSCYAADHRCFPGYTIAVFSGTTYNADRETWYHESIHTIQAIQADSIEPPYCGWLRKCSEDKLKTSRMIELEPVQLGVLPIVGGGALSLQDYTKRWTEIEATWLANHHAPQ